jgi:hypothetical protein
MGKMSAEERQKLIEKQNQAIKNLLTDAPKSAKNSALEKALQDAKKLATTVKTEPD